MTKPLSPYQFRQIVENLKACGRESATRQIAMHRANGDFTDHDCDSMQRIVNDPMRFWLY